MVAPELEIATEYQNTFITNYMFLQAFGLNSLNQNLRPDDVLIPEADTVNRVAETVYFIVTSPEYAYQR